MDIRYHWLRDRETQKQFRFIWKPAKYNKADYFSKHHPPAHHQQVRAQYVNLAKIIAIASTQVVQKHQSGSKHRAQYLRGCVVPGGIQLLGDGQTNDRWSGMRAQSQPCNAPETLDR